MRIKGGRNSFHHEMSFGIRFDKIPFFVFLSKIKVHVITRCRGCRRTRRKNKNNGKRKKKKRICNGNIEKCYKNKKGKTV
jgi:hypothetical protein